MQSACAQNASWCLGSESNANTGQYGAFSVCNSTERGSWILDQMYRANNKSPAICTSAGGVLPTAVNTAKQPDDCKAMLKQAGPQGTGTVTYSSLPSVKKLSSGRLSTSESIGVAIGVTLAIIFFTFSFLWLLRKRRRASAAERNNDNGTDTFGKVELPANPGFPEKDREGKAELPYSPVSPLAKWNGNVEKIERVEIDGDQKFELEGGLGHVEMPADYQKRIELEDTSWGSKKS